MMTLRRVGRTLSLLLLLLFLGQLVRGWEQSPLDSRLAASDASEEAAVPEARRVTVREARRQAELLHSLAHATLQLVHERYYREDEGLPIPAAVVNQAFAELKSEQQVTLRWLAVEGQAMNTDHRARDAFEREAVAALQAGKKSHEQVEVGLYRRAAPITLTNHCLKCHVPDRKSTEDRSAGLVVSIPVSSKMASTGE